MRPLKNAIVTFYTPGSVLKEDAKSAVTLWGEFSFRGNIFVDDQKLGRITQNKFLALELPPGPHTFSASLSGKPSKDEFVAMQLEPGEHYCVRLRTKFKDYLLVQTLRNTLVAVNREDARTEKAAATPLAAKRVVAASRGLLVPPADAF